MLEDITRYLQVDRQRRDSRRPDEVEMVFGWHSSEKSLVVWRWAREQRAGIRGPGQGGQCCWERKCSGWWMYRSATKHHGFYLETWPTKTSRTLGWAVDLQNRSHNLMPHRGIFGILFRIFYRFHEISCRKSLRGCYPILSLPRLLVLHVQSIKSK